MPISKITALDNHKKLLAAKGYSLRSAAPLLGVDFSHLSRVLAGERKSESLLRRIEALKPNSARS